MDKFRVRLKNGRVLGPFLPTQFKELFEKGHIDGTEDCQIFPVGDWRPLNSFEVLLDSIDVNIESNTEATFIRKISEIKNNNSSKNPGEESIVYPQELILNQDIINEIEIESEEDIADDNQQNFSNNTTILKRSAPNFDKTIINKNTQDYLEQLKLEEQQKIEDEKKALESQTPEIDYENDSTQMINLNEIKNTLKKEINHNEKELLQKEKIEKKILNDKQKLKLKMELENQVIDEVDEVETKKPKKLLIVLVIAFIFLYLNPFEDEKKKIVITPVYSKISFPQRYDSADKELANKNYVSGMKLFNEHKYTSYNKASKFFKAALENDYKNINYMAKLILVYSKLLDSTLNKIDSSNKIFKLVQISLTKAYKSPDLSSSIAFYFYKTGKINAALNIIEKYNIIKKSKPSLELFSVYLTVLTELGNLEKAKAVYDKLIDIEKRSYSVDLSLIKYNFKISNVDEAFKLLIQLEKKYPNNVELLLVKARYFVYKSDFKALDDILKKILNLKAESSPIFYAKYLEYKGMLAVSKNNIKKATKLFKLALSINESSELRSRLSLLELSDNDEVNLLILESKALQEINKSKAHIKNKNWKFAFLSAIEASRIAPEFIEAKLFLANLQVKLSYFEEAITTLERLYKNYPSDKVILFSLVNAYINSYRHKEAQKLLVVIATSDYRSDPQYYKLTAKLYLSMDNFANSVKWLQTAINKNPLDDTLIFDLAKLFIRYNRFDKAKVLLSKCMDLDPSNINYRIAYANIVYETDGATAAIGYLYDLLMDFPDNAQIYSEIGINYYKSGQLKSFEQVKEKLQKLPKVDETLYKFLIMAAELDDRPQDVIKYSKMLIRINPYDLQARINLGKVYMDNDNYTEAIKILKDVEKRVESYPMLQYYMSKLYLLVDDTEKAIEFAKKEVKSNPASELGYILLGDIYVKQEKFIEGEKEYKKAQRINPKNVDTLLGLANINFKKSQYEISLDLYKKAISIDSNRANVHKLIGDVYRKIGQSDLAVKSYKTFLELSPSTKYREQIDSYIKMME